MTNDPSGQTPPTVLSPLPDQFEIPAQLLQEWVDIPPSEFVQAQITRRDLDHLFFGLMKNTQAQDALQQCLIEWSNNRVEPANQALHASKRLIIESQNELRQFFTGLMVSATRGRDRG